MSPKALALAIFIGGVVSLLTWGAAPPSEKPGWPITVIPILSDLVVGDLDYDGQLEIVAKGSNGDLYAWENDGTIMPGWPKNIGASYWTPSLADVDGNGTLEIITTAQDVGLRKLKCFQYDGTLLWEVTSACCFKVFRTHTIADVNADGALEIFAFAGGSNPGQLWLLDSNGNTLSGWPILLPDSSPSKHAVVAEIDGTSGLEILMSQAQTGNIWAWHYDGSVVSGYPLLIVEGEFYLSDMEGTGSKNIVARSFGMTVRDLDGTMKPGWPQTVCSSNPLPSLCDVDGNGQLETGISSVGCAGNHPSYLFHNDGTNVSGWPADRINFSSGDEMLIGDTDGDGKLNFINGATENDLSPDGRVHNFKEDGTSTAGFPWDFPNPTARFGGTTGVLVDLDLDGTVDLGLPSEQEYQLHFWSLGAPYNPLNMHWRMAGGNMQHTGEWHPPSYYIPRVDWVSPALTWVTSCPVTTLTVHGKGFESIPFIWFVPSADVAAFYGGDLSKGIAAVAVAQPQIHPISGLPQNPLNATYLEITTPALATGTYELVIQNPTGIRNTWTGGPAAPLITVTNDPTESQADVGNTFMVNFGPSNPELTFDWADVGNAEYVVIYDTDPSQIPLSNELAHPTTNSLTSEVPVGADLFFRIVGVNSCGYGP